MGCAPPKCENEKEMQSTVKPPEKREHEPEKDKSKVRSKKPTNAVSIPALPLVLSIAGAPGFLVGMV
ncbi:hypothetical protein AV530_009190 [Patagioenas fasciata monilis]|uniref:Uncharacterized protein n=1 Tax=Patagioenas fasciata monilis TaxID=372326 RepID=A0A1V4K2Y6_PATFA|nr:hypothetical protein AV530_009190 [Patagioenas fasciata monilis]